jgi:Zn-finger nucleic acid-binding protein
MDARPVYTNRAGKHYAMSRSSKPTRRKIECPRCWVALQQEEVEVRGPNVIIDVCPTCGGIWLDSGELNRLLRDRKLSQYLTKHIGTQSKSPLVCPSCGWLMDIETAEDVDVDVCLNCGGVWLDAGELEKLKAISNEGFEGDERVKEEERWEEQMQQGRESALAGLLKRLARR